jgi:hypothetical protein
VMEFLREGRDLNDAVPEPEPEQLNPFAALMATGGEHAGDPPVPTAPKRTLFEDDDNFLADALAEVAAGDGAAKLDLHRDEETDLVAFNTPKDLAERLKDLPESYLRDREVGTRIRLSAQPRFAEQRLAKTRADGDTLWPDVSYLAPIHPVLEWANSRALARFGRDQAPVMAAKVQEPVFLTQATWSNSLGQPVLTQWGAITGLPDRPEVRDLRQALEHSGLTEQASNPGGVRHWLEKIQPLVPTAVDAATEDLRRRRDDMEQDLLARLDEYRRRLERWEQLALAVADHSSAVRKQRDNVISTRDETSSLIDSLAASGEPFVRVIGLIVPTRQPA